MKVGRWAGRLCAAASLIALWPAAASAQISAPREDPPLEFGPLSLYPSLRLVDVGKDSNVFIEAEEPQEDYTLTVSSRALAVLRLGLNELILSSGHDYVWFREFVNERSNNAQYAVRFNAALSRFKPFVGAARNRVRSRPNPEIDARARRLERSAIAGLGFGVSDRTSIIASAEIGDTAYNDGESFRGVDLTDALNRRGRTFTAGVRYAVTPLTTLAVAADYTEDTFQTSEVRNSRAYTIAPVVEFSPEAAIRGRVLAGFQLFRPDDRTLEEHRGFVVNGQLNWSLYGRTSFELQGIRDVSYSYLDSEPYYLQETVRLSVAQPLFRRLELLANGELHRLYYRWRRGVASDAGPDRGDTTRSVSAGIGFHFSRAYRLAFLAERTDRRSNADPHQDYNRTRLLTSVTIGS